MCDCISDLQAGPMWDCRPPLLTVVINSPQMETRFSGMKHYTVYEVETKELGSRVSRKYKHFLWLYDRMAELFPCVSLPPLPVKQFSGEMLRMSQYYCTNIFLLS